MAAFAKFGSDLDKSTQALLARGSRLTELLKQDLYAPYAVEQQIVLLYAGTNGYIDQYPESALLKYEKEMLAFIESEHAAIFKAISEKHMIEPSTEESLKKALDAFKEKFKP